MKKISLFVSFFLVGFIYPVLAQKHSTVPRAKKNWVVNPFDNKKFIENKGQFNADINTNDKVLYQVKLGNIKGYLTANGIIYEYDKYQKLKKGDDPDDHKNIKPEHLFLKVNWEGANSQPTINAMEEQNYYCAYNTAGKNIKANAFKRNGCKP